ncbi:iron-siderophore ABC transporter substrate-binding protein [Microbacterium indicum]|uniref:iron-siderophore ABC transporter substrate-binding protein n=1 Tax=Microbacterium indicum TaxID=358100 RepID=UPI0003F61F87|nr:iron-siderophore ABC transporter substrate-binding protein [Microbacterium indicum]
MRLQRPLAVASVAIAALALTACGSASDSASSGSTAAPEALTNDGSLTVEHAFGTTEVPAEIDRVATVGWGNQDVALALGVAPVGVDNQTWSMDGSSTDGVYEWTSNAYDELGAEQPAIFSTADGTDFEAIADVQPDVILAAYSGLTQDDYDTLTQIAPTVAYPETAWFTPWRDTIRTDAAGLGLADEGDALVDDLDQQIADAVADAPDIAGKTAAFFYIDPSDTSVISVYGVDDSRTAFLGDLGFDFPSVAENTGDQFYADISAENADLLDDVDVIVSYGDESTLAALQADPLWSTVPAIANGAVVAVGSGDDFSGAVTPTALSIPMLLDDYGYVSTLNDAAGKAE